MDRVTSPESVSISLLWYNIISLVLVTVVTFWANLADDKLLYFFFIFPRKQVMTFHANCLHWRQFAWNVKTCFQMETICMKCQNLFSGKKKKNNISVCRLLKILPRMLSVKKRDCHSSKYKSAIRADKTTNYFVCIIYITPNWGIIERKKTKKKKKKKQTKDTLFIISVCTNLS